MKKNEKKVIYSIVMPTYNSERTIEKSLLSIRKQHFDQKLVEIIVVDGGSSDQTVQIATKYDAVVLKNPYKLPEPAKLIGVKEASGSYLCLMDSDEIIFDLDTLKFRYDFFEKNSCVHGILVDLTAPDKYNPICSYMNEAGDPFSCFIYKRWGNTKHNYKKNMYKKTDEGIIYRFKGGDLIPIGDCNTVMDLDYIRNELPDMISQYEPAVVWDMLIRKTQYVGYIEDKYMIHLSSCDFKTYLKKLKFRVINNVHNIEGSGYAFRAQTDCKLNRRKYLYPLYCISLVLPICDGIRMSVLHRKIVYLLHPIFSWYVMGEICKEMIKKSMGKSNQNISYGL